METILKYASVVAPVALFIAFGYILETALHVPSSVIRHMQIWAVAFAMLFTTGVSDKIIFRYVTNEETKRCLMRAGFVSILFLIAFLCVAPFIG